MKYHYADITLNCEIVGEGKPVVILHGLGCEHKMMGACLEPVFLKKYYKRFYIDLPGMGKSTGKPEYASSDKVLEILLCFINDNVDENYLLIGESYGGYLARGILSKDSAHIDGMALLCPVVEPIKGKRVLPQIKIQFADEAFLEKLSLEEKNDFCEYAVLANEDTYHRYKTEIWPGIQEADSEFINELESHYLFSFDVDKIIHGLKYNKPVLFICGKQDTCVGYEDLWKLLKDYPRATFSVLDMAGHNLQIEQDQLFGQLMENWLLRVEIFREIT